MKEWDVELVKFEASQVWKLFPNDYVPEDMDKNTTRISFMIGLLYEDPVGT